MSPKKHGDCLATKLANFLVELLDWRDRCDVRNPNASIDSGKRHLNPFVTRFH
jgi:hypothetical protein